MIIDFHTHIFSPHIKKDLGEYIARDPCFAALYSSPEARMATADELIASMDRDGVDISVVLNIGWTTPELCVETNDYILESVARFPKRLIGFGSIQPRFLDAAVAEIERCAAGGLKGVGELRPDVQAFDITDRGLMTSLVEALVEHKQILLTHASEPVGHQYPGKGTVTPDILYRFITAFPQLTVVCAHWGGGLPLFALMPEVKKALSNVYFDTAASPFLYSPRIYQQVVSLLGADKILFGSDYPLMPPNRLITEIKSLALPGETESLILGGNARRLLNIPDN
ncbi:MAG: amidohydrolase family protein [Dehalococcoidales bacterium]|nr:amidohydrolase family protein [Dehalococcoidales bacterium]